MPTSRISEEFDNMYHKRMNSVKPEEAVNDYDFPQ